MFSNVVIKLSGPKEDFIAYDYIDYVGVNSLYLNNNSNIYYNIRQKTTLYMLP